MTKKDLWFSKLLNDVKLGTTLFIGKNFPDFEFKVIEQTIDSNAVYRKIAFLKNGHIICEATNKVKKNKTVNDWINNKKNIPFGEIFKDRKIERNLISKDENSRTYRITGEIEAEVYEKFFNLPK